MAALPRPWVGGRALPADGWAWPFPPLEARPAQERQEPRGEQWDKEPDGQTLGEVRRARGQPWLCSPATRHTGSTPPTKKTGAKEISDQGPGSFTEPFTIPRASTFDKVLLGAEHLLLPSAKEREVRSAQGLGEAKGWRVETEVEGRTLSTAEPPAEVVSLVASHRIQAS